MVDTQQMTTFDSVAMYAAACMASGTHPPDIDLEEVDFAALSRDVLMEPVRGDSFRVLGVTVRRKRATPVDDVTTPVDKARSYLSSICIECDGDEALRLAIAAFEYAVREEERAAPPKGEFLPEKG